MIVTASTSVFGAALRTSEADVDLKFGGNNGPRDFASSVGREAADPRVDSNEQHTTDKLIGPSG